MSRSLRHICALTIAGFLALAGCGGAVKAPAKAGVAELEIDPASRRPIVPPIDDVAFPTPTVTMVGSTAAAPSTQDTGDASSQRNRGVELISVERHTSPAVYFRWLIPGGRALEFGNEGRNRNRFPAGTMALAAELLVEGTLSHRGDAFSAALERHGATLDVSAASDAIILSGRVLSHQLRPFLALVAEALGEPEFDSKLLEIRKQQHRAQLESVGTRPSEVAGRIFNRVVYGEDHPYGMPTLMADSLMRITRRHLIDAHRAGFAVGGSSLVVVGDIVPSEVEGALRDIFAKRLDVNGELTGTVAPAQTEAPACHVFHVPDAVQSVIVQGNPGPKRADDAWSQAVVANQILGGSASSRLFTVLRERKSLTYGIYSSLDGRLRAGDWSLSTSVRTPMTAAALDAIATELTLMQSAVANDDELSAARRFLIGQFVMSIASGGAVASRIAAVRLYGLPESTWSRYVANIATTDGEAARAAAQRWFGNAEQHRVIVGDLDQIRPALDARCTRIELRDADGRRVRTVLGPDGDMTDSDRSDLFAVWARDASAAPAIARYVADKSRSVAFRADALKATLMGPNVGAVIAMAAAAPDAGPLTGALVERLLLELRDHPIDRARAARVVLFDLVAPETATTPLPEAMAPMVREALARYAFAGVSPDSAATLVMTLVPPRIDEADLARLGAPALDGLEALVSSNLWRESAAKALIAQRSGAAVRALVRAYRRALVIRRVLPSDMDLELIEQVPDVQTALLLLDTHALLELAGHDAEAAALPADTTATELGSAREAARAASLTSLRRVVAMMAETPAREAGKGGSGSVLDRDIRHIQGHLEAILGFRDADDRWWAATLLIRHRSAEGLRLVLSGLADDDRYADPAWQKEPVATSVLRLCANEIAPLGIEIARPQLLAALAGRHRIAKILAVVSMRVWGDDGSLTALRTHVDPTDIAGPLGYGKPTSVTELARAAVDLHRVLRRISADRDAARIDGTIARRQAEMATAALALSGAALDALVDAVRPVAAKPPAAKGATAAPATDAGRDGEKGER